MSDDETGPEEKLFCIEVAKQGRAGCKKCKDKCLQGEIRIAKLVANPFGDGKIKAWHHINCIFEVLLKQRPTTKRIEGPDDIDGWNDISKDDQDMVLQKIEECNVEFYNKHGIKPSKKSPVQQKSPQKIKNNEVIPSSTGKTSKDNLFKEFRRLISDITNHSAYLDKTNCVRKMFTKGTDGNGFKGNIILWCQLLLPGVIKRVYYLQSKQLIKLFSRIFGSDHDEMLEHLEQGDIGETVQFFFENSHKVKPAKNSKLTVEDVDKFLQRLSQLTREEDQIEHLQSIISKCTSNDLKLIIRLIKGDLRMGAGAKHILDGVHPDAYEAYQASRDIQAVISKCLDRDGKKGDKNIEAGIKLMTPVLPMLAEACKSVEQAMKKCPNGMYSEIKYDGERVQVHKRGTEFKYFSRALKPVLPHKIQHFKDYIPQAFPHGHDMILDSEILMIDTNTGKPLPFGTLGKHKKAEFQDANVCLFVFDCLYYNGERLFQKPLSYRKKILRENMKEISNRLMFSEMEIIHKPQDLVHMIAKVLKLGLEGLVLKDIKSTYEPGKRHWLKVKKDYLLEGAMADSADLLVLGAWYGTGKKGGMMSVFLMGCYNPHTKKYCTVTKVHTGHDDKTLEKLQSELEMEKISQDASKVPHWLKCTKTMIPDFVAKDPKKQPVWEITGAEFTQHDVHTADGISIRFPRVTRIRDDKNWETATNLEELQQLYKNSKENIDVSLLIKGLEDDNNKKSPPKSKTKKHDENEQSEDESTASDDEPSVKKAKKQIGSPLKKKNKKPKLIDQSGSGDDVSINSDEHSGKKMKKTKGNTSVSETTTNNKVPVEILNPFPDYFQPVKALLEEELKKDEHADLLRCFVAYGGTIVEPEHWKEATHVFHYFNVIKTPVIKCPYNARHLSIEWIKDSVAEKCLQDSRFYTVQWDPEM